MSLLHLPASRMTARSSFEGPVGLVVAGLSGLLAAATAVAVGHLIAALVSPPSSPLLAVGSTFIDLTPEWLKSFAIATLGEADKVALLGGIGVTVAIIAIGIGLLANRHPRLAAAGLAGFGLLGAVAAVTRPGASLVSVIPSLAGALAGVIVLWVLGRATVPNQPATLDADVADVADGADGDTRRRFLGTVAGVGIVVVASGGLGILLAGRRAAGTSIANGPAIPVPLDPAAPIPAGVDLGIPDVASFITPNDRFYRVDTALVVPSIDAADWRLRIHGMVDREVTLTLPELLELPLIERDITLTCVSNQVGGEYAGNARWTGVSLATVLAEAGVQDGADQIVSRSIDGMTIGTPTVVALDGRDAMLAVTMNGEPLPPEHGYPVRLLVPGLYGYVSATKWLVELELTTFAAYDPYWVERGWAREAPIKTMARIDAPRPLSRLASGTVAVAGVAWAQHRGIDRVEVRVDGGDWQDARLGAVDTIDTWRQWVYEWPATAGNHTLEVRATDATGETQPETRAEPFPSGATGWHSVVVTVT